ncbi:fumarylacetoacetate hydrolase family protein [Piscinibacter koreensis]|uniref:Fumarylacetoacetate hydrolase family protein n=1 Tax=Piscinibacter koreensis TaxID=2742824 RepID=A0A7Y6NRZ4_9BURK|nr:fumarylacetoacetate hydrolase family protein [Schlegelella koreensis]NUZ08092.1 fumarylacetoacetate hydrolase family protein [Schlegelella koreensis]
MKIARFNEGRIGVVQNDQVVDLTETLKVDPAEWPPVGMLRVIRDFDSLRAVIEERLQADRGVPLSSVRLQTPIEWPNKLLAYPVNYHDHATEMASVGFANIKGFFLKANSSLVGPADCIVLPDLPDRRIDHECELGVIIGKGGRQIPEDKAIEHVFGYSCLIDVTVRGQEERVMRKSFDTFTVVGPWIATVDEVGDARDIGLRLWVNGELRQDARTRDLIVNIPQMVALASSAATLHPGDIIATGTPAGVGPILPGDEVVIEVERVGRMQIRVMRGAYGRNFVFDKTYNPVVDQPA